MSRLQPTFEALRQRGRTGLVTYVTAGDPDLACSARILEALDRGGADVLEVGVPFSDPLADGPVIQRASERALAAGATLGTTVAMIAGVRSRVRAPIVVFSYANPILRYGVDRFARDASSAGVDGVLVLDLPLEESEPLRATLDAVGLDLVFLVSPTTSEARIAEAARLGRGFLYAISRLGVTGARQEVADGARALAERIRRQTSLPIALGFGLSTPAHVAEVGRWADAAVVGSALVEQIVEAGADAPARVEAYVRWLKGSRGLPGEDAR
ncbi:MAG: tryptophan synthase subunit alpha [Acidobacteria bacterium]|nr:tryptophan synthase subunit alpha [Acidobacteriota bacterium]